VRRPLLAVSLALGIVQAVIPAVAPAVTAPDGFTASAVVTGLDQPTGAAFAPDGRLFVLEKAGAVRIWSPATGLAGVPAITLPSCTASEMGLLGIAFDAAFATNGFLYLYHTRPPGDDVRRCGEGSGAGRQNRVVRVTMAGDRADPASLTEIIGGLRTDNGNHDGGCLRIGPDGFLYVGVGDTGIGDGGRPGASTNPSAADVTAPEGKILRLTLDGSPAPGNPFAGRGGAADFVFALGLRNPFRFAFDPRTGLLWAGDVGQSTFEEIDIVRAGDDMGWPRCEGFQPAGACPGTVPPVYVYSHPEDGASVTGGVFYDGSHFDVAYRGDYFFGDYVLNRVWRARLDDTRTAFAGDPEIFLRDADGPTDFLVGPDGALYYVAINTGSVVRVTQDQTGSPDACGRALAGLAPRLVRRAARRPAACGDQCPAPAVPRGAVRTLSRACGTSAPAALCAGLGCGTCQTASDLASCFASAAAGVATEAVQAAGSDAGDRCARSVRRAAPLTASRRLRAVARCARRGGASCATQTPPAPPSLGPACRNPSESLCLALACAPCGRTELRSCVDAAVAAPSDTLVRTLLGD
jgi:glucose/arabinose dehydrogenase